MTIIINYKKIYLIVKKTNVMKIRVIGKLLVIKAI